MPCWKHCFFVLFYILTFWPTDCVSRLEVCIEYVHIPYLRAFMVYINGKKFERSIVYTVVFSPSSESCTNTTIGSDGVFIHPDYSDVYPPIKVSVGLNKVRL